MSSVSSLGVGSNLDLSGLLDQLAASESAPLVAMQKQQISYTAKLSAYGSLQNALSNFQAAATKLSDATLYQGASVSSSAADVLSAIASASATPGTYSVNVTQLAQAQSLAVAGVADASAKLGTGTITIDFGTSVPGTRDPDTGSYSGSSFSADADRTAQTLVIDSSNNTLEGVRDAINAKSELGVTASIINDGGASPYRLVLNSSETGSLSSMRISVADDSGSTASLGAMLNHDTSSSSGQRLQQTIAASNAALSVNGIAVTSRTNTVEESIPGVTLTLSKTGLSNLTVSQDSAGVVNAVATFVNAYNYLQATSAQLTKFDFATKAGAPLVGDSTLRNIQTSIRSALNSPQPGTLKVLSNVGVTFEKDGMLAMDADKLQSALTANRDDVVALFAGTEDGSNGFGTQLAALVDTFTGTGGKLSNATAGVNATLKSLDTRYAATELTVEAKVARYRAQFTQLDVMMSQMNSTTSYLTQQFNAMNNNSNN